MMNFLDMQTMAKEQMNRENNDGGEPLVDVVRRGGLVAGQSIMIRYIPEYKYLDSLRVYATVKIESVCTRESYRAFSTTVSRVYEVTARTKNGATMNLQIWDGCVTGSTAKKRIPLGCCEILSRVYGA